MSPRWRSATGTATSRTALWPWAADTPAAQAGPIEVIPAAEINFEQVAALDPDVIFAIGSGIEQGDFDTLSAIAPTVAQSADYNVFGTPWDVAQLTIGKALGLEPEAQALVDDINAKFAAAVEANPDWQGLTGTVSAAGDDGSIGVFTDGDNRGHILTQLGFVIPEEITEIAGDSFYADISAEQISLLDNDLLVYIVPEADRAPARRAPAVAVAGRGAGGSHRLGRRRPRRSDGLLQHAEHRLRPRPAGPPDRGRPRRVAAQKNYVCGRKSETRFSEILPQTWSDPGEVRASSVSSVSSVLVVRVDGRGEELTEGRELTGNGQARMARWSAAPRIAAASRSNASAMSRSSISCATRMPSAAAMVSMARLR